MIRAEKTLLFSIPREALWELLSDTERLNRELKLPSVAFTFTPRPEGGSSLRGQARFGPVTLRYVEEPYHWVKPSLWWVQRFPENGPVSVYRVGVQLETEGAVTRLMAWSEAEPRGVGGRFLAQRIARSSVNGLLRACTSFVAFLEGRQATPYPIHAHKSGTAPGAPDGAAMQRTRTRLEQAGLTGEQAARLIAFLLLSPPEDVVDFRPFALADRWGLGRTEVLKLCLKAVRAGALELHWRLLCPACRGAGPSVETLDALTPDKAHCASCNISFGPAFDQDVEVCFSVAPALRKADDGAATYCIGGPHRMRHVVIQWQVPANTSETVGTSLPRGTYRLRSPQRRETQELGLAQSASVVLANTASYPMLFRLESLGWREDAATAAQVTALSEFRKHFGSEVLAPGQELVVRQVTILFTDLKGSTQMYATHGDAPSYATVRAHFEQLSKILETYEGGVVKTIGDSIMAAFTNPEQAVQAALAIQREAAPLVVKLGLCSGPALAVTANGQLDYFGQTVNLASRIQGQSHGGDIVLPDGLLHFVPTELSQESFTAMLKGTDAPVTLWRIGS
ncbi:DUF5939 domain-containing protein [Armatimonas sp.]|uniref:adenylate/guanylate cyclase domain-containing protein n=1 Tax=Armatimonas sp. TaxID=1872638 RepID=UPI00374FF40E